MLAHALGRQGQAVGLFTSPHLHHVGERIRIDGLATGDDEVREAVELLEAAEAATRVRLTFFEVLTMVALLHFERADVDFVVLEAGLGGRLDSTSVREAEIILMTQIGLDHESYLGQGYKAIAGEKAAVIHSQAMCLSAPQSMDVRSVIEKRVSDVGARLEWPLPARSPLPGAHQRLNAGLALAALRRLLGRGSEQDFADLRWAGRFETLPWGQGEGLFDVAHNADSIAALCQHLKNMPPEQRPDMIIFGSMADKKPELLATRLTKLALPLWLVPPPMDGAMSTSLCLGGARSVLLRFDGVEDARFISLRNQALAHGARILVCGSHFLVASQRAQALNLGGQQQDALNLSDPIARE